MEQIRGSGLHTALVADEYGRHRRHGHRRDLIREIVGDIRATSTTPPTRRS